MAHKVKPVKVQRLAAEDVAIGELFTLNGVQYVKLSDYDDTISCSRVVGILATTVLPLCTFDSVHCIKNKKSVENRAVDMFMSAIADIECDGNIITYGMPDADDLRQFGSVMEHYIKDVWYVDNGVNDSLSDGEYFYVDEDCNLNKGNEYDEREDGVSRRLGLRALYSIDPDAIVTIKVNQKNKFGV